MGIAWKHLYSIKCLDAKPDEILHHITETTLWDERLHVYFLLIYLTSHTVWWNLICRSYNRKPPVMIKDCLGMVLSNIFTDVPRREARFLLHLIENVYMCVTNRCYMNLFLTCKIPFEYNFHKSSLFSGDSRWLLKQIINQHVLGRDYLLYHSTH